MISAVPSICFQFNNEGLKIAALACRQVAEAALEADAASTLFEQG